MKIKIDQLSNTIEKELKKYTKEIEEGLEKAKQRNARQGAKELRESPLTPVSKNRKRSGKYKKGWTSTKHGTAYIIRNKTDYQLTHLLEKGHALRQGGRTRAFPHIKPVEEKVVKNYEKDVEKVIKGR